MQAEFIAASSILASLSQRQKVSCTKPFLTSLPFTPSQPFPLKASAKQTPESTPLTLTIKTLKPASNFTIKANSNTLIKLLKKEISELRGVDNIKLIFKGKGLSDENSVGDYFTVDSTLHMICSIRASVQQEIVAVDEKKIQVLNAWKEWVQVWKEADKKHWNGVEQVEKQIDVLNGLVEKV